MLPIKKFAILFLFFLLAASCHRLLPPPPHLIQSWGEQKTFDYQGIKINYYDKNRGPTLILLHGFGASAYTWRFLGPALAEDYRVFTLDLKGFGYSDKPRDGKYAVRDQADIVAAFIRAQNLKDMVLIGNSMGGGVALMTYLTLQEGKPGPIKGLVLIDSAGYPQKMPWFIRLAQIPVLNTLGPRLLSPRFLTGLVLRKCYYNKEKITEEAIDAYAYFSSLPGAAEAVRQTAAQIRPRNFREIIARYRNIRIPTLIIWGEADEVVPLNNARNFDRDIPDSQLVILPQCGHIPQEEEAEETILRIRNFLKKEVFRRE